MNSILNTLRDLTVPARQKAWTDIDFEAIEKRLAGQQVIIDEAVEAIDCQKIIVEADADIQYVLIQNDQPEADSFRTRQFYLEKDAKLEVITILIGGATSDLIQEVYLQGSGAECLQKVAMIANAQQRMNLVVNNIHIASNAISDIVVKTILSGSALTAVNGLIKIKKDAQLTNSYLRQDVYSLSDLAKSMSIPGLEIDANEVKASHSATQSKLKAEDLLYLTSRGLMEGEAKELILEGFVAPLVERIKQQEVRERITNLLADKIKDS